MEVQVTEQQDTDPIGEDSTPKRQHWFRVHHDTFFDDKIRPLRPAQRWLWVAILGAASKSPFRGLLLRPTGHPMTEADLADLANIPTAEVKRALPLFVQMKMVAWDADVEC